MIYKGELLKIILFQKINGIINLNFREVLVNRCIIKIPSLISPVS